MGAVKDRPDNSATREAERIGQFDIYNIYADDHMDSLVPLRCPMPGDRAAREPIGDHQMFVVRDGHWALATQEKFDAAVRKI
jgi:hypothetical protein